MNKKNITLMVIAIITLLSFVLLATYAYFAGTLSITNKANLTASTEKNNMVFDTVGGAMLLNVTATNMQKSQVGLAAQNSTTLTVNFQANTSYNMVCTYDIIYEWTSNAQNRYTTHTSGVTANEFTIQATLASNSHVYEGTNSIHDETDLSTAVGNQVSATVVSGAQIDGTGSTTSTAVWTITSKFYNVNANQSSLANKSYAGRFKVANVSCVAGEVTVAITGPTAYWFATDGIHTFPSYGGTLQTSGSATGHNMYIGQDSSKYYSCATIQGHEACFSFPITQYTGELGPCNDGTYISNENLDNLLASIGNIFNAAGISNYSCNYNNNELYAYCTASNIYCGIEFPNQYQAICYDYSNNSYYFGYVSEGLNIRCGDNLNASTSSFCRISENGAYCYID